MAGPGPGVQVVPAFPGRSDPDELCEGTLRPVLVNTILDRATGGMLITPEGLNDVTHADDMVKFSSAVAHLIGRIQLRVL